MAAEKNNKYASKYNEKLIEDICKDLLDWAETAQSIHFSKFCRKIGKSRKWLCTMAERYPKIKEAVEEAKDILSAKIVDSCFYAVQFNVNAAFGEKYLPIYDSEYKELLKWKAQLNNLGANDPKNLSALKTYLDGINEKKVEEESSSKSQ